MEELENDADGVAAIEGALTLVSEMQGNAGDFDFAAIRAVEGSEEVKECAFPASAGAGDGGHAAFGQGQGEVVEGTDGLAGLLSVAAADVVKAEHGRGEGRELMSEG